MEPSSGFCLELGGNNLVYLDKCQQQCWEFLCAVVLSSLNAEEEIWRYTKQIHCFWPCQIVN